MERLLERFCRYARIDSQADDEPLTTPTLRVFALNAAKCWFHEGGLSFASTDTVRSNLDAIGDAIETN